MQALTHKLRPFELTPTQYNVLRIRRGAHPGSLTCTQVGERMVTPVPDVTRLLDRLLARRLVWKARDESDRRIVRVEISSVGLDLLASIDEEILGWLEVMLSPLEREEMRTLGALAAKARRN
jgi:DNA-binding MarR family transcriptional regulator